MGFGGISERFRILGVWSDASSLFLDWVFRALEIVLRNVVIQGDCDSVEFYWQIYMTSWDFNWFWGFQRYVYDRLFFLGVLGILGSHYVGEYLSKLKKPKEEIVSLNSCNSKISFVRFWVLFFGQVYGQLLVVQMFVGFCWRIHGNSLL